MLAVRDGDARAFERIVERWLKPLVHFFHRLGADPSSAEDCAQEVFVKLYRSRATYEPKAKFSTYLFHVARHHWIDVVRHRAVGPPVRSLDAPTGEDDAGMGEAVADRSARAVDAGEARELRTAIRAAVAALPSEQREVFALAQVEGLRYEEIGRILEIPLGTVKSRMHAAVRALRARLRRAGFEP
jgi:RNA polymerase sigma-70 factor (ECF subfamily)